MPQITQVSSGLRITVDYDHHVPGGTASWASQKSQWAMLPPIMHRIVAPKRYVYLESQNVILLVIRVYRYN